MIAVENTLVSDDVLMEAFVCDLKACKGACCVAGDAGAPLEESELKELEKVWPIVKEYLPEASIKNIEEQGLYVRDVEGEWSTPLNNGNECAFTLFESGQAVCGIEKAYKDKRIDFAKPVSCHLYPIRITSYDGFDAVNYHKWSVCEAACSLGKQLQVPVYKFLKEPLIRKYGEAYYEELELIANHWNAAQQ